MSTTPTLLLCMATSCMRSNETNREDYPPNKNIIIQAPASRNKEGGSRIVMNTGGRRNPEQQSVYTRQATILRKNLGEWDAILRNPRGEDWPRMLGRLNAAFNQTANMDKSIEDVMEHFVYLPKQSTANAQDIPFFLSTRLDTAGAGDTAKKKSNRQSSEEEDSFAIIGDPADVLTKYEARAAELAREYDEDMDRF